MTPILLAVSIWLHALATVVLIGHYTLLGLIYLPAFTQQLKGSALGATLESVAGRARLFVFGSLGIFVVTGVYLMLGDANYRGFGDFGNAWSVVMLVKHILVLAMIGIGAYIDRGILTRLADAATTGAAARSLRQAANAMMVCGTVVLLLTAAAQVL